MTEQLQLIPKEEKLTDRQEYALKVLRSAGHEGLQATELGAELCARNGRHDAGDRCLDDRRNGLGVLRALRKKGHAKSRRNGTWYATSGVEEPDQPARYGEEIPF